MRVHSFHHVPFEGLGSIAKWLESQQYDITQHHLNNQFTLPEIEQVDALIVMGGPMSANDDRHYSWLVPEKQFIRSMIDAGKPVLGICLGAQLIASVLGARVYPSTHKEIGWWPVKRESDTTVLPATFTAFHWHGEMFDVPDSATLLASSDGCQHQAFRYQQHVIGLQFHLETTPELVDALLDHCYEDLTPGTFVQNSQDLSHTPVATYQAANAAMKTLLKGWLTNQAGSRDI
ncbi:glutamine amidotransferase, class I [Methylophaga frappieri]|uniref:Glutamine amidotransferase, class I n=1 Tax=Methylophaga frappieri (strain ATCC BAA-2434 / DSM 25690 / JAM7) TaxID=754477 RepID=I1YHA9_METFJ|nr:type 1 glutamine amidotransferase [Methylophaga frappieri]AFJ02302.1 glutamine amidotransferase, class I [Methylophaga frappieri]